MKNRYYIIEPLDINGDKNPDGFLISQYRLDKYGNKIFLKNKYVTYELAKKLLIKKGGYSSSIMKHKPKYVPQQKMIMMTEAEYNVFMNNKSHINHPHFNHTHINQPHFNNPHFNQPHINHPHFNHTHNQYPPEIIVRNKNGTFGENFGEGLGLGMGLGIGFNITELGFDALGELF
jgi:hypothetical protein